jgi:Domain of unknown function (DUF1707)
MATGSDLRIGDADREAAAASLREHYAQGRLTMEEFSERLDATFAAVTQGQLNRVTRDLPHVSSVSARLPASSVLPVRERPGRDDRYHHHQHYRRHHHRSGLASLLALAATLMIMAMVVLPDLRLPLPGRLGVLIAIFAVIRGVLRRILRGSRS